MDYTPNDSRYVERLAEQTKVHKPGYLDQFIKNPLVTPELINEINTWDNITEQQQGTLKKHMAGTYLTPSNYIKKIVGDYMINNELFREFYKPHPERHIVNLMLQRKIGKNDDNIYEFYESDHNLIPELFYFYENYIRHDRIFTVLYHFPKRMLCYYAVAAYCGWVNKKFSFPDVLMPIDLQHIKNIRILLNNPFHTINGMAFVMHSDSIGYKKYYVKWGSPQCMVETENYSEHIPIWVYEYDF